MARELAMKPLDERLRQTLSERSIPEPNSGCILWIGAANVRGYGHISVRRPTKKTFYAHRISYELSNGPIPEGLEVLHSCDVPSCVNPRHLVLGTRLDNAKDAVKKGRTAKGVRHGMAILTEAQVRSILLDERMQKEIAAEYGVTQGTVGCIQRRETWKHIS